MISKNKISIVTVSDNNFIMLLAALLKSIEVNHKSSELIDFYIVEDKISVKNKKRFEAFINKDFITINWLKLTEVIPKNAQIPADRTTYPLNIYARLFIPHFIPQHIDRILYLDVDMIVLEDISLLWDIDLEGNILGAVQDPFGTVSHPSGIQNYKELGIHKDTRYFNSGLLLIDALKWRKNQITTKVLECVNNNKEFAKYPDQYGLNVVLANMWKVLNPKWNSFSTSADETDPYLIHFIGYKPIYNDYTGNKDYSLKFYSYLALTWWKSYNPKSKYLRYFRLIRTKLKKILKSK